MKKKYVGAIIASLLVGALVGSAVPTIAADRIDRKQNRKIKKLNRKIGNLADRIRVIEDAPDTTTGLADNINQVKVRVDAHDRLLENHGNRISNQGDRITSWANYFYNRTSQLDSNGRYYGVVNKDQVTLTAQEQSNCGLTANIPEANAKWRYNSDTGESKLICAN